MIYYINYSHVGFMPLRLKMQPHSKVDLKYILAKMKVLLIVINGVQYLLSCSILLPLECLISFLWLEIKFEIREASSSFYSLLSSGLLFFFFAFFVVTEWSISFMCEACLNSLFLRQMGRGYRCPWLAEWTTRLIKSHLGCTALFWGEVAIGESPSFTSFKKHSILGGVNCMILSLVLYWIHTVTLCLFL